MASLEHWILLKHPRMCILESATTILVRVEFSIANFVFPFSPQIRPIARLRWSPWSVLTSFISNDSRYRSSSLSTATESYMSKPSMKHLRKSVPFWIAPMSSVCLDVLSSTARLLVFIRTCSFMCSTSVLRILSHSCLRGVNLCLGTGTLLYSAFFAKSATFILSNSISFPLV